jgi:hypothetical protein
MKNLTNSLHFRPLFSQTFGLSRFGWRFILFGGIFALVGLSCGQRKEAIVQQKIAEKTQAFRSKKAAECRESLLMLAEKRVDSLLLAEAQQQLLDSLSRSKPGRPTRPVKVPPIDSLVVRPLFDQ